MSKPWWMNGLQFACQADCGKCCDQPGGIVYLRPEDAERLATHHDMSVEDWLVRDCRQTLDGRYVLNSVPSSDICIYLDTAKRCTVYESRPAQCASYPFWSENLRSDRSWQRTLDECPGLDAEDSIIIDGDTVRVKVLQDRDAMRGFREWPSLK